MLVSVVVPTLNEAAGIAATLASVARQDGPLEVVVADGGSADGTAAAVRAAMPGARVLDAPRGRSAQMNAGASAARGEALLFLHADTHLPEGALAAVRHALADPAVAAGCFRVAFDDAADASALARAAMRLWAHPAWSRRPGLAFGDRALFARRAAFDAVGGFPAQPLFEDLDVVRRLRRVGRFAFLGLPVRTSARRFRDAGAVRQQVRNALLWLAWRAGADPARLKRFYPDARR